MIAYHSDMIWLPQHKVGAVIPYVRVVEAADLTP
jgi:hypothetical protein